MKQKIFSTMLFIAAIITFWACGKTNETDNLEENQKEAPTEEVLLIENPWIRPANSGTNTALFFKVINNTKLDDTLYSTSSDLAEIVEVHETYQKGADVMGMRHVDRVVIPSGTTVEFKPRDLHVMFIRLFDDLAVADSGDAVLLFKNAGEIKIKAVVRDMPPMLEMSR